MLVKLEESPIISRVVAKLRNKYTRSDEFRKNLVRLGEFLAYEYAKMLPLTTKEVESPLGKATYSDLNTDIIIIGILRAALPMVDGVLSIFNEASLGVIAAARGKMLERDGKDFVIETNYSKIPACKGKTIIIVDPMLASGSTILKLINLVIKDSPQRISVLCAIASEYGIKRIEKEYPEVDLIAGVVDQKMNEHGYIIPGLGDAGDRAFNTINI